MIVAEVTRNVGVASDPSICTPRCPLVMELLDSVSVTPVAVPMCTAGALVDALDTTVPANRRRVIPALLLAGNARQLSLVVAAIVEPLLVTVMPVDVPTKVSAGPATMHVLDIKEVVRESEVPPTNTQVPPSSEAEPKAAKLLNAATLPVTEMTADAPVNEPPVSETPAVLSCAKPKTAWPATNVDDCAVTLTVAAAVVEK